MSLSWVRYLRFRILYLLCFRLLIILGRSSTCKWRIEWVVERQVEVWFDFAIFDVLSIVRVCILIWELIQRRLNMIRARNKWAALWRKAVRSEKLPVYRCNAFICHFKDGFTWDLIMSTYRVLSCCRELVYLFSKWWFRKCCKFITVDSLWKILRFSVSTELHIFQWNNFFASHILESFLLCLLLQVALSGRELFEVLHSLLLGCRSHRWWSEHLDRTCRVSKCFADLWFQIDLFYATSELFWIRNVAFTLIW